MTAPSQAEIRLKLTEKEMEVGLESGTVGWLTSGINIEEAQ